MPITSALTLVISDEKENSQRVINPASLEIAPQPLPRRFSRLLSPKSPILEDFEPERESTFQP